jgi:tricorn protease
MFAQGGKMMLWFSDRLGLRATGGNVHKDVFGMFFTREAFDQFNLDKAEYTLLKKAEDDAKDDDKKGDKKEDKKNDKKDAAALKLPEPVAIERDGLQDRVVRLTPNSGNLRAAAMTADGEGLLFVVQTADGYELWLNRPRSKELKKVGAVPGGKPERGEGDAVDLVLDAKGENGFLLADGGVQKFKVPKGEGEIKLEGLKFSAEMRLDRSAERAEIFEHVWRQMLKKLYVQDMNGVDWAYYRQAYEKFLPFITNNHDLAQALSEMLGELNVSHTGSGYRPRVPGADATAALGLFFDEGHAGAGLKVSEVIAGGPLEGSRSRLRAGMVIEAIDGVVIAPGAEVDSLLNQKAGKRVQLVVFDPAANQRFDQVVKPISLAEQNELLYQRWVKTMQAMVARLSGGKLGYVHVRGMNDDSYRDVYADMLGRHSDKQAMIVDTRFNGGGNLTQDLAVLLSGKRTYEALPRGQSLGWEPWNRWTLPSLVVMSESQLLRRAPVSLGLPLPGHRQAAGHAGGRHRHRRVVGDAAGAGDVLRHPAGGLPQRQG